MFPGVDADRAGGGAEPVGGAGLLAPVAEVGRKPRQARGVVAASAQPGQLARHGDALARRGGEGPRRALRLAEAALDAAVDDGSAGGSGLRCFRWARGSSLMMTPGLSRPCGSSSALTRRIIAKAAGPHSSSTKGAMLRPVPCSALSEPSKRVRHHLADVVEEGLVAGHLGRVAEVLGEDEVEVPVEGVAEDDPLGVAVAGEGPLQLDGAGGQVLHGEGHVLDDDGGADAAGRAHRREEAAAVPEPVGAARSAVKTTGPSGGDARGGPAASTAPGSAAAEAARTSTSRAQASGPSPASPAGMPGLPSTARSEARSMSSAAATTCRSSRCTARAAARCPGRGRARWPCGPAPRRSGR